MRLVIFAILFSINGLNCLAQDEYIEHFDNRFTVKAYLSEPSLFHRLRDEDARLRSVLYTPNTQTSFGFGGSYKGLGTTYSFRLSNNESDIKRFGTTKFSNWRFNYYTKKYGFDGYYQFFKGFYLNHPDRYIPNWAPSQGYPSNYSQSASLIGINLYKIFNENFSLKSAFYQSERQKKRAGSLLLMGAFRLTRMKNNQSYIPASINSYFDDFLNVRRATFIDFNILPGYGYTFIKDHFFFTPVFFAGPGIQPIVYTDDKDNKYLRLKICTKANLKASVGYNGNKFYIRLGYDFDVNSTNLEKSRGNMLIQSWELVGGLRIK